MKKSAYGIEISFKPLSAVVAPRIFKFVCFTCAIFKLFSVIQSDVMFLQPSHGSQSVKTAFYTKYMKSRYVWVFHLNLLSDWKKINISSITAPKNKELIKFTLYYRITEITLPSPFQCVVTETTLPWILLPTTLLSYSGSYTLPGILLPTMLL